MKDILAGTQRLNKEWELDWQFYLNMCNKNQPGCIGGIDKRLATKEGEKQDRKERVF